MTLSLCVCVCVEAHCNVSGVFCEKKKERVKCAGARKFVVSQDLISVR